MRGTAAIRRRRAVHAPDAVIEGQSTQPYAARGDRRRPRLLHVVPEAKFTVDAVVVDPPRIAIFTTVNATHVNEFFGMPGTNRHIEFRNARLMETDEDGLIARERRIYDFTGLLVQIGVLRAKPAKP
jgi:predicted ester cyclase